MGLELGFALHAHSKQHALLAQSGVPEHSTLLALLAHNALHAQSALHALLAYTVHCLYPVHCLHTVH